jgi:hypothetical protein
LVDVRFWHLADIENRHLLRAAKARKRWIAKSARKGAFCWNINRDGGDGGDDDGSDDGGDDPLSRGRHGGDDVVVADLDRYLRQPSCVICPRLCETRIIGFQ